MPSQNTRVWGDTGVEPNAGNEVIQGGEEYPAEWMNWAMYMVTEDIDNLFDIIDITGLTPTFTNHDHSEAELTTVPAGGIDKGFAIVNDGAGNISLAYAGGLEGDGAGSVRVRADQVAGNGLVEGPNPYTVDIAANAIQLSELDESIAPTWSSQHVFQALVSAQSGIDSLPTPTTDDEAANKGYVDSVAEGLDPKESVRAATDGSNVNLGSTTDPNPIDGVTLNNGDRVLLKDQTTASENGIYEAVTATDPTTWVRTDDADEDDEVTSGMYMFVDEGTANGDAAYVLETADPITVGTTSLTFKQFSSLNIIAGDGLTRSGDTFLIADNGVQLRELDEAISPTWTAAHTFAALATFQSGADFQDTTTGTVFKGEDGVIHGDTLESGDTLTIAADEAFVAGESFTINGDATLNGDLVVVSNTQSHNDLADVDPTDHLEVVKKVNITLTTGATPAFDATLTNVFDEQTTAFDLTFAPRNERNETYAFNWDAGRRWQNGSWDVPLTVNWDEDPGTDIELTVRVHRRT